MQAFLEICGYLVAVAAAAGAAGYFVALFTREVKKQQDVGMIPKLREDLSQLIQKFDRHEERDNQRFEAQALASNAAADRLTAALGKLGNDLEEARREYGGVADAVIKIGTQVELIVRWVDRDPR
jgi:hypothetical protein